MKIRVLPVVIFVSLAVMGGKALDIISVTSAQASAPAKKEEAPAEGKEKKEEGGEKEVKEELPNNVTFEKPTEQIPQFTDSEKEVLEKLAARRGELDAYAKDLEMKETLLDASSKKLDEKLAELKSLRDDTDKLLKTYNEQEDVKLKSLVKIYENMKPKDAAAIFEQMNMEILLDIIDRMSERKVSPVLAAMTPKKARQVTEQLAVQRSLRNRAAQKMQAAQAEEPEKAAPKVATGIPSGDQPAPAAAPAEAAPVAAETAAAPATPAPAEAPAAAAPAPTVPAPTITKGEKPAAIPAASTTPPAQAAAPAATTAAAH